MNAKQARSATTKALTKKGREAQNQAQQDAERRRKEDEYSRNTVFSQFMRDTVRKVIKSATFKGEKHTVVNTTNRIVADLVVKKLVADGYEAHSKDVYIPEERSYGDSGEGMHDAYTAYIIHINWGSGECKPCRNEMRSY